MSGQPVLVEIPADPKKLKRDLKKFSTKEVVHEGLKCALTSSKHKRHHKNAYIILVGQTGAGKSTTINTLFDQKLTETGDYTSTTSEITEYSSPVKSMAEMGVTNSEIHIIDTPGLGDTRGIEQDAKFIATMQEFLENHSELKGCFPSALLLVAKFDDNRLQGAASPFVRMLKAIKLIEHLLIDPEHTNIVIVLTHYMHSKRKVQKDPQPNYDMIKTLVKEHVGFPSPILVVGAENDAEEYDLRKVNDYFELPGGEFYPYNLFEAIRRQCTTQYDPIGEAVIRKAFADSSSLQARKILTKLLIEDSTNVMYSKAIVELIGNQFKNQVTPISEKLRQTWDTMITPSLRKTYPEALAVTQSIFHLRNIRNIGDIPESATERVKLLKQIPQNEAILGLLSKGLYVHAPLLKIPYFVGQGYNLEKDEPLSTSPFYYTDQKISSLGYLLPVEIQCEILDEVDDKCIIVNEKNEYIKHRLNDLGLRGSGGSLLGESQSCKPGYNIFTNTSKYSMLKEYRKFKLTLKEKIGFSKYFLEDLAKLPKPSASPEAVDQWKDFFSIYGTHLISEGYGGGSIEIIQDLSAQLNNKNGQDNLLKTMKNVESQVEAGMDISRELPELMQGTQVLKGGDHQFQTADLSGGNSEEADAVLENWIETLDVDPVMLENKLRLQPLSHYVKSVDAKKAADIETAMGMMKKSISNLKSVEDEMTLPPKRQDVKPLKQGDKSSCLKKGTSILMADFTQKPVENLLPGDTVLDMDLRPCTIIGCNYFFLGDRKFYGLTPESKFFTEIHIFVGPGMQFKVVAKDAFLEENPIFEYFGDVSEMAGEFSILAFENNSLCEKRCQLYIDNTSYPVDTPVYFLEVDSPSGTYFANGYLCRHELPPFDLWPKTFACLQELVMTPNIILPIIQEPFTPATLSKFSKIAASVAESFTDLFENEKVFAGVNDISVLINERKADLMQDIGLVLSNQSLAAFGLLLYSKCGKVLYANLDKQRSIGPRASVNILELQKLVQQKIQMYL